MATITRMGDMVVYTRVAALGKCWMDSRGRCNAVIYEMAEMADKSRPTCVQVSLSPIARIEGGATVTGRRITGNAG